MGGLVDASGDVWAFGASHEGQTGTAAPASPWQARKVGAVTVADDVVMQAGASHACVLSDGAVWCFGSNTFGQIRGVPTAGGMDLTPISIDEKVSSLGSSGFDMWALGESGRLWGWGANNRGVLSPLDAASSLPVTVLSDLPGVDQVQSGVDRP